MKTIHLLIVLSLCVLGVRSMALNGPIVTWYRPCGLGVVIFEKSTPNIWQATINLDLYHHLDVVNIYINFEDNMDIIAVSKKSQGNVSRRGNNFTFSLFGTIPRQYTIYLKFVNGSTTNIPRVSSFQLNNIVMCNDIIKEAVNVKSFNVTKENDTSFKHMCGQRSLISSEINEIMADAKAGDWPWHVAILIRRPRSNLANYQCGGSVISSTAILTAGHCVFKSGNLIEAKRLVVEAGLVDLRSRNETGKQILNVQKVILHPDYNIVHATSDLAILVVNKLQYTEYVQPICLWGPLYDKTTLIGRRAVMTGFGTTENDVLSSTLRSVYTLVQNDTTCIAFNTNLYTSLLNEFTFCAGLGPEFGVNPRNGDSGGGLTVSQTSVDNRVVWFLRGVLSKCGQLKGNKFCDPKYYVVYTDVAPHYGWIYHNGGFL